MRMRTLFIITLLAMATLWMASCSSGTPAPAGQSAAPEISTLDPRDKEKSTTSAHTIMITGYKFQPAELTVKVGDTVEWKNMDSVPHNAVANDRAFDSGKLKVGMTGKFVAADKDKGTHEYSCTFHPNMKAKLIVD